MEETLLKIIYFERRLTKNFEKINLIFSFVPRLFFMDNILKKGPGTSYQSLFGLKNMFRNIFFLMIHHLGYTDDLIQGSFLVIPN